MLGPIAHRAAELKIAEDVMPTTSKRDAVVELESVDDSVRTVGAAKALLLDDRREVCDGDVVGASLVLMSAFDGIVVRIVETLRH